MPKRIDFASPAKVHYQISDGTAVTAAEASVSIYGEDDPTVITTLDANTDGTPDPIAATEGQTVKISGVSVSDVDDETLSVTLGVADGTLKVGYLEGQIGRAHV